MFYSIKKLFSKWPSKYERKNKRNETRFFKPSVEIMEARVTPVAPSVLSINLVGGPTVTGSGQFAVTFNQSVTGVTADDFLVVKTGTVNSGAPSVTGSGANYTVTVNGISGLGTLGLNLQDNSSIRNSANIPLYEINAPVGLKTLPLIPIANGPEYVALGDVNGDGFLDFATSNLYSDNVSVVLGNGDGSFKSPQTFAAGNQATGIDGPRSLLLADLDGDSALDIATANGRSYSVSVLLGNGDGTFKQQTQISTKAYNENILIGDFDGDGNQDLLTDSRSTKFLNLILGNGNGTFKSASDISITESATGIAIGDLNKNGKLDITTASGFTPAKLSVLLGNGNGTFSSGFETSLIGFTTGTKIGDINQDGLLDVGVANTFDDQLTIFLGNGDGTLKAGKSITVGKNPEYLVYGDMNGDGLIDIVNDNAGSDTISVHLGNGDGTFKTQVTFTTGDFPTGTNLGDFNNDGRLDIASPNIENDTVSIFMNSLNGNFTGQVFSVSEAQNNLSLFQSAAGAANDKAFTTQPVIRILDSTGSVVTSSTAAVTMAASAGGSLIGNSTVNAVAGVATFTNAGIKGLVGNYTLTFSAQGLTSTSQSNLALAAGAATQISLTTPAAGAASDSPFTTQPVVTIKDSSGNTVTNFTGAVAVTSSGGATLVGNSSVNAVNGIATFSNVGLKGIAGKYDLAYQAQGLTSAGQSDLILNFGAAAKVSIQTPASGAGNGIPFTTQPVAAILDSAGNKVTNSASLVTLGVSGGDSKGASVGTVSINASSGVATFTNAGISGTAGVTYTLTFSSGSLVTASQNIPLVGVPSKLGLITPAAGAPVGQAFLTQPVISILDAGGNLVTTSTDTVTLAVSGGDGQAATVGTITASAINGLATFTNAGITGTLGTNYNLVFSSGSLTIANQSITPFGVASKLDLTTSAGGAASDTAFTTQPIIRITDSAGSLVSTSTAAVTLGVSAGGNLIGTTTVNAVGGVATFTNAGIKGLVGNYTLTFSGQGLTGTSQSNVALSAGTAAQISLTTPVAGAVNGSSFTTQPVVTLVDSAGNTAAGSNAAVSIAVSTGGTLTGTTTVQSTNGIATFTNVGLKGLVGNYTLIFSSQGLTGTSQSNVALTAGPASQITLTTQASGAVSGSSFTTQPVVTLLDSAGNTATGSNVAVSIAVSTGGTLTGTTTVQSTNGVVTFTDVGIKALLGNYTLTFTAPGLTERSQSITLSAGSAAQLNLNTSAAGAASDKAFTTQPVIRILDSSGNVVTTSTAAVTLGVSAGGTLIGNPTVNAVAGVATFTNAGIKGLVGNYTLTFTSQGLTSASQSNLALAAGSASQISLTTPAAGAVNGSAFTTQPVVTLFDSAGNTAVGSNAAVSISVSTGGTLTGTTTVQPSNGVATFTNAGLKGLVGSYDLSYSAPGITSVGQTGLPLAIGPAAQLGIVTSAAGAASGKPFTTQPVIAIQDIGGNLISSSAASVTMSTTKASTEGNVTVTAVNGLATFVNAGLKGEVGTYTLNFQSSSLSQVQQTGLSLTFGDPVKLGILTNASGARNEKPFRVQPVLAIQDSANNTVTNSSATVAMSVSGGDSKGVVNGNVSVQASNGKAVFTNAGISGTEGANYTLVYTSSGLNGASQSAKISTNTVPLVTGTTPVSGQDGKNTGSVVNLFDPTTGKPNGVAVPFPGFMGELRVSAGDINGDGKAEIVAGAGPGGGPAINILDSETGASMSSFFAFAPEFRGGVYVNVNDVTGDGVADIIVGAGTGGGPHVKVFNGTDLKEIKSFFAYDNSFGGGVSVAAADIDGDNVMDIVTGAGPGGGPHVKVFNGTTLGLIKEWFAFDASFRGGVFVAMGDLGGDGDFEVVTGAGPGGGPMVRVWDPFTAQMQAEFFAYELAFTGGVRVGLSDGNGDGVSDLVTGAGPGGGPHVKVFSGTTFELIDQFFSGSPEDTLGVFVS